MFPDDRASTITPGRPVLRKTPLVRRTPLRPRKLYRPPARAESDKVSGDLYAYVMLRDGECVARKIDPEHVCSGTATIEHVNDHAMMGKRAPSDRKHCLRLCLGANINGWASAHKNEERAYLRAVEP